MAASPSKAPPGADGAPSILDAGVKGEGLRGLLISLLTIFDVNKTGFLSKHEYEQAAGPLGFDTSDDAWTALCQKFGDKTSRQRPVTAEGITDTQLDMQLIGAYFSNKYDPLLEEILRRLGFERWPPVRIHQSGGTPLTLIV